MSNQSGKRKNEQKAKKLDDFVVLKSGPIQIATDNGNIKVDEISIVDRKCVVKITDEKRIIVTESWPDFDIEYVNGDSSVHFARHDRQILYILWEYIRRLEEKRDLLTGKSKLDI